MASSVIDICNMALGRLGDRATVASIDPPEGSAQADHCARWYPLARDVALSEHAWGFNTVRSTTDPILVNPQPGWLYAYAIPNDCLNVLKVIPSTFVDDWWLCDDTPFTREAEPLTGVGIILTDMPNATIVYTKRVEDTTIFPPLFVSALAWLLASYLAGPVVKGAAGRTAAKECYSGWVGESAQMKTIDANQSRKRRRALPDSMKARGYGRNLTVFDAPVIGSFGFYAYPSSFNG